MTLLNAILQNDTVKVLVLNNHKSLIDYIKEPNTIIALLAIIVSIIGLWISVRYNRKTLEQTIKHNKLSVEPMLFLKTARLRSKLMIEIILKNEGLGTGIINSYEIIYKNKKYNNFQFILNQGIVIQKDKFLYARFGKEKYISSNSEITLLRYNANTIEEYNWLHSVIDDIEIQIEYESMYGDKKTM